ncbi:MAG TPA: ABC transporter permease [Candidatus Hydrogenedentes bacterium]|nr:ABC transporter permease [Candidatus Hydrogenedentota bacterium]
MAPGSSVTSAQRHDHPAATIGSRAARYLAALLVIATLNFLLPRMMPGDPLMNIIGEEAYYAAGGALDELRADLGLDQPLLAQYGQYLGGLVTGDWGYSYLYLRPVRDAVALRLGWTLALVLPSVVLAALLASLLGGLAAWRRSSRTDIGLTATNLLLYSMPHYWLAMLALFIFSFRLGWFPLGRATSAGASNLPYLLDVGWHMFLPLLVITAFKAAYDFLIVRGSVVSILGEDYVLMAQAKGLSGMAVLFKHALRSALAPLVTVTAIQFGMVLSGALLVEVVFSWPGMGTLIYDAIGARDYPLLQSAFFMIAICVLVANFIADMLYPLLDPRTR